MARILVMPDGNWLSHVSRPLEIAKALAARGHEVVFAAEGRYTSLVREANFDVVPVETLDPNQVLECSRRGSVRWWDYASLAAHVKADQRVFEELGPDLVLGDFRLSLATSCELARMAMILNAAWTNYYTVRTRSPEHLWATRFVGAPLANLVAPSMKAMMLWRDARPFRRLRRELGLTPRGNLYDQWRGDLNLLVDTPDYGPTAGAPDHFRYVGPVFGEPRDAPVPPWLKTLSADIPTIYITMGSTGHGRYFHEALKLFEGTNYQCIMTTAGLADLPSLPANIFAVDVAPGGLLMEKSDVVVCHGGNGTIYQAMTHGVPIVGIPTMHDQEFNLDRVVDLGMGIHLSDLRFKPNHLLEAVERILSDPSYKQCAQKQAEMVRSYDGPQMGADTIEAFLRTQSQAL